ncbi:MAG: hypothetical protein WKG07_17050 [Hymenobacter sp.]
MPIGDAREPHFWPVRCSTTGAPAISRAGSTQPLGPFLGKNFASSVSPWVVTLDALEPFRVAGPAQDPTPSPTCRAEGAHHFDIRAGSAGAAGRGHGRPAGY